MGLLSRAKRKGTDQKPASEANDLPEETTEAQQEVTDTEEAANVKEAVDIEPVNTPVSDQSLSAEQENIKTAISKFQETNTGNFCCVIFDGSKEDHLDFSLKVSEMVNTLGTVIPLSPARPLILIPETMDWELITHRLSKSLNSEPVLTFEADSAENAINRMRPLIENGSGQEEVFTFQI